jgi:excisionase family DNA binding protein
LLTPGADRKSNNALQHSFTVHRREGEVAAMQKPRERKEREEVDMLMEKQKKQTTNTLMTVKDVATYLAVTERTVYRLVKDHKLPAYKVGGQWRFKADMIEAWMQKDGALESLQESAAEESHTETPRYAWKAS